MTVLRKQRRVGGKKQNYYWDTELGCEVPAPVRKQHYAKPNPMQGLIGCAARWEPELMQELGEAFANFNGPQVRNGLPGISINRLLDMAHTDSTLYSTNHPDSVNGPVYDAALGLLLLLCRDYLVEWEYEYREHVTSYDSGIDAFMQELGYDTANSTGSISNSLNVVVSGANVYVGAEANKEWLRLNSLSTLQR